MSSTLAFLRNMGKAEQHPAYRAHGAIRRVNGYEHDAYTYYPVVIIGAGESGIAMGCQLKQKLGFDQFRVFEKQAGIGGTWWVNRYPGIACDVPAAFYSFSFAPNPEWTSLYPSGPEIVQYLQSVCEKYEITDKVQVNTEIQGCRWLGDEQLWEVQLRHLVPGTGDLSEKDREILIEEQGERAVYTAAERIKTKIVVSCVGALVEPRPAPEKIPGFDTFKGDVFHSARWRNDVNLKDKDVIVMGTGCSAAQFVPKLTKPPFNAKSVTQLMRSPPWVCPKLVPPGGDESFGTWAPYVFKYVPGALKLMRFILFANAEYDFLMFGGEKYHERFREKLEKDLIKHMKAQIPDKYVEILTPDYGVGCKRRIFDYEWLRSLNDPNIELTTLPLTEVHEKSVTLGPGRCFPDPKNVESSVPMDKREVPADTIILANGFNTTRWFHPLQITGRGGMDLIDTMEERGGPQAYLGTAMDGFPNFFIIFGPNTATGHSSVILASENMVQYSLKLMKPILKGDASTVEIKKEAEIEYTQDIQAKLKNTIWQSGGCQSWYYREDGWNSTVLPYSQIWATYRYAFPYWSHWNIAYTKQGKRRKALRTALRILLAGAVLLSIIRARRRGMTVEGLKNIAQLSIAQALHLAQARWRSVKEAIKL